MTGILPALFLVFSFLSPARAQSSDPLPSWNEGASKKAIVDFVAKVTKPETPDFVPEAERIAVFDNDGTLWCEQPIYFQGFFLFDRIKALAPQHPEWTTQEPYASALKDDIKGALDGGQKSLEELLMVTHAGMTAGEFSKIVADWLATVQHPGFKRPYNELAYQPMIELLAYLRANGFKTFIVSGGGVEFMRVFAEKTYGLPPEQVVGSSIKTKFEMKDGKPVIMREAAIDFIDDGPGKPVGIGKFIGRRPLMAFGNSDGDFQMLQYTTGSPGSRFAMIIHHTDADREYAYDRQSAVGKLDKALDAAAANHWLVVSMKDDWKTVFASPKPKILESQTTEKQKP